MNHKAHQLILHFGLAKTGTTALQNALFQHRGELLERYKTLYPGTCENHFYFQAMFSKHPESLYQIQVLGLGGSTAVADFIEEYRQGVLDQINESKPARIIISSEYFSGMSVNELKSLRSFLESIAHDIVVFAYVRDPWSYSVSLIQQMIRSGLLRNKVRFGYVMSNVEIFAKFEEAFDKRATVASYGRSSDGWDVVGDFCQRFGLALNSDGRSAEANEGMMTEAACMMLQLNQLYPVFDQNNNYIHDPARDWMAEAIQNSPLSKTPIRISTSTARKIYEQGKADIELMEERYFGGVKRFSELYETLQNTGSDDTLCLSRFGREEISGYLLSCMRILSERAMQYYKDGILSNGKYYAAIGNAPAARDCFTQLLRIAPQHDGAIQGLNMLDSAGIKHSPT